MLSAIAMISSALRMAILELLAASSPVIIAMLVVIAAVTPKLNLLISPEALLPV